MIIKTEVLCTSSRQVFVLAGEILRNNGINFKSKAVNRNFYGLNNRKTIFGTLGENLDLETQYYIHVRLKDKEEAEYLIRKLIRDLN